MELEPTTLAKPTSDADSLISTNDPDTIANEQTWPTDEEMGGAEQLSVAVDGDLPDASAGTTPKTVKKVPKGTSQYQAAWIVEEEGEDDEEESDANSDHSGGEKMQEMEVEALSMPREDDADVESDRKSMMGFKDFDAEEEDKQWVLLILKPFPLLISQSIRATGWNPGGHVLARQKLIWHFRMNLTLPRICLHDSDFSVTGECALSEPAHGILTRTYLRITPKFSNSKTIEGQSEQYVGEQRRKQGLL